MKLTRRILPLLLAALILTATYSTAPAQAASLLYPQCDCEKTFKKLGICYGQYIDYLIVSKTRLTDTFDDYVRASGKNIRNMQVGAQYPVTEEPDCKADYSFTVQPSVSYNSLSVAIGFTIAPLKYSINGQISPQVPAGRQWIAPYYRKAYRNYSVVERKAILCAHGKILKVLQDRTYQVKVPFKDAAFLRFGAASTKANLPATVRSPDDPLFRWQ